MSESTQRFIEESVAESSEIIKESISLSSQIEEIANTMISCIRKGNKIVIFGNGGSAADAQHIVAELIGRFKIERDSYPALALTTDSSIITSLANDYSYDIVFSRQCESLISKGDVTIGISTSGNSKNIENGLIAAKKKGAITIGLLGNSGGRIKKVTDMALIVNSSSTPRIQEVHRVVYHIICEIVEKNLSKGKEENNG